MQKCTYGQVFIPYATYLSIAWRTNRIRPYLSPPIIVIFNRLTRNRGVGCFCIRFAFAQFIPFCFPVNVLPLLPHCAIVCTRVCIVTLLVFLLASMTNTACSVLKVLYHTLPCFLICQAGLNRCGWLCNDADSLAGRKLLTIVTIR